MEFCVALMLVLLGVLNLTGVMRWITERLTPAKPAGPEPETLFLDRVVGRLGLYQTIRPLVVGLVHGLAGSAAVALLVLSTIKSLCGRLPTCWYLVRHHVGMALMTAAISMPLIYTGRDFSESTVT